MKYKNLLLIDDDLEDQEIFCSAIEELSDDIACNTHSNAKVALEELLSRDLTPDLIFLDLNMPIMTGMEFLHAIKQIDDLRSIPVVIFTTSASIFTINEAKSLGAIDFITKPNSFNLLVENLKSFFDL